MEAAEQYFPVVLFIIPLKIVLTFSLCMKSYDMSIGLKNWNESLRSTLLPVVRSD